MANRSIIFRPPLKNFHLSGDALNRKTYSSVNHDIHTASIIASSGLSCGVPLCSLCNDGNVFNVKAIVDRTMKSIDTTAMIWNQSNRVQKPRVKIQFVSQFSDNLVCFPIPSSFLLASSPQLHVNCLATISTNCITNQPNTIRRIKTFISNGENKLLSLLNGFWLSFNSMKNKNKMFLNQK